MKIIPTTHPRRPGHRAAGLRRRPRLLLRELQPADSSRLRSAAPWTSCRTTTAGRRGACCAAFTTSCRDPQGKLVRVVQGEIFDVAVDIRRGLAHLREVGERACSRPRTSGSSGCRRGSPTASSSSPRRPRCSTRPPTTTTRSTSTASAGTTRPSGSTGRSGAWRRWSRRRTLPASRSPEARRLRTEGRLAMNVLLTGGCGFIGSNLVRLLLAERPGWRVVNLDKLTYAGNAENLADLAGNPRYRFVRGDICNGELVADLFRNEKLDAVMHLAAESHVDRSILAPVGLHRDQRARHAGAARGGPRVRREALPARLHRRGLRLARPHRPLHRDDAARPVVAVLGVEGLLRPAGARLLAHLQAAR